MKKLNTTILVLILLVFVLILGIYVGKKKKPDTLYSPETMEQEAKETISTEVDDVVNTPQGEASTTSPLITWVYDTIFNISYPSDWVLAPSTYGLAQEVIGFKLKKDNHTIGFGGINFANVDEETVCITFDSCYLIQSFSASDTVADTTLQLIIEQNI